MKRFFIFLLSTCFIAAACNKESPGVNESPHASVSIYAVVPAVPAFNIFLNGNNIAVGVPFGSYTLYNNVAPGMMEMKAQSSSRDVTIDTTFPVEKNQFYSLFLTDTINNIKAILLHDYFPSPDSGKCGLRFLVLSPGVPNIDFYLVRNITIIKDTTTRIDTTTEVFIKRSYGDNIAIDSVNTFKKFDSGTYAFYAVNRANIKDTLARLTNKVFNDSTNYTIMLEGLYNKSRNDTSLVIGTRLH